ncbi:MAG: DNA-directed RNA polymerase subunit omega [bacterium]
MPVKPIDIEKYSTVATDIYEAIVIASKRARQIHSDTKIELNQRIEILNQLSNVTESEDDLDVTANPDQLRISLEFEKRPKPTDTAIQELTNGKVDWRYNKTEEKQAEEADNE